MLPFLVLLWLLLTPLAAEAQVRQGVTGIVRQEGTGLGIQGAFVALLDRDGRRVGGVLTLQDGRYLLRVARPGTYRLQPERIGFRADPSAEVTVRPGQLVRVDLTASADAIELAGIAVDGDRRCDLGEEGRATMELWEQASRALAVARWTEASERFAYELRSWERSLGPRGRQVISEREQRTSHVGRHAYRAIDPAELESEGYARGDLASGFQYFAPDAETLLSDGFLRTHCFRSVREGERLGLEFEPIDGRRVPEVEGTLWMAPASTRLERLEYRYVNIPDLAEAGLEGRSGGEVVFEELEGGEWIVRWWEIRMPVLVRRMNLDRPPRPVLQVAEIRTQGGEVEDVRLAASGVRRLGNDRAADRGSILGEVVDSTTQAALAEATVYLSGTDRRATSGGDGSFVIDGIRPGIYTVALQHPRLAQLGVTPPTVLVEVAAGVATVAELSIPSLETLVAEACAAVGSEAGEPGTGAVGGVVRTGGVPVEELAVEVTWQRIEVSGARPAAVGAVAEVQPDRLGRWGVCSVPTGHRIQVRVVRRSSAGVEVSDALELGTLERSETRWVTAPAPS